VAESLWLAFNADVEVIPAMTQADFEKATQVIAETVAKY
jgi:hypothetical protein